MLWNQKMLQHNMPDMVSGHTLSYDYALVW
jgi:hypothetical protein